MSTMLYRAASALSIRGQQHLSSYAELACKGIDGVESEVALTALYAGEVSRCDPQLLCEPFLRKPSIDSQLSDARTEYGLERSDHLSSVRCQ